MAHSTVRVPSRCCSRLSACCPRFWHEAELLPQPTGKPILTVTGKIAVTNDSGKAVFDREMIEALGETSFSTSTPWYDGAHKFEGVPLGKLLDSVGGAGDRLVITALNDYVTEIPIADAREFGVILALKRDGQYMPVSDKGPILSSIPSTAIPR